jgi:hypothetical protein
VKPIKAVFLGPYNNDKPKKCLILDFIPDRKYDRLDAVVVFGNGTISKVSTDRLTAPDLGTFAEYGG